MLPLPGIGDLSDIAGEATSGVTLGPVNINPAVTTGGKGCKFCSYAGIGAVVLVVALFLKGGR